MGTTLDRFDSRVYTAISGRLPVQTIWQAANEAATGELATLRAEARHTASAAETERDAARTETAAARESTVSG